MARKCFEYRGWQLQALNGQAAAVSRDAETGKRTRIRLVDKDNKPVAITPEATARAALISSVDKWTREAADGGLSVQQVWDLFIAAKKRDQKPTEDNEYRWRKLRPTFGSLKPSEITDDVCVLYCQSRFDEGRAPDTVWTEIIVLQAALSWGLLKGHWSLGEGRSHEDFMLWRPNRSAPRDRAPTREEVERLIECAQPDSHLKLFIMIATYTGARKGAILELKWDQVDLDNGVIDFRSKVAIDPMSKHYKKGRATVAIGATLRTVLRHFKERARDSGYVIEYGGRQVEDVKKGFAAIAEKAGLYGKDIPIRDRVTAHSLRHSVATWLEEDGIAEKEIQKMLGHAPGSKVTRKVYISKTAEQTREAADTLDRKMVRLKVVK
jgi:integrase